MSMTNALECQYVSTTCMCTPSLVARTEATQDIETASQRRDELPVGHGCDVAFPRVTSNLRHGTKFRTAKLNRARRASSMDLSFTGEELAFREEVRAFLEASVPAETRRAVLEGLEVSRDDTVRWQQILHRRGWGGPNWPKEFAGTGWDPVREYVFEEESASAGAPRLLPFGLKMVGPVIMRFGNVDQQKRFLPRILSGEDWWAQGYSEPGAGSDLASL